MERICSLMWMIGIHYCEHLIINAFIAYGPDFVYCVWRVYIVISQSWVTSNCCNSSLLLEIPRVKLCTPRQWRSRWLGGIYLSFKGDAGCMFRLGDKKVFMCWPSCLLRTKHGFTSVGTEIEQNNMEWCIKVLCFSRNWCLVCSVSKTNCGTIVLWRDFTVEYHPRLLTQFIGLLE